MGGNQSRIVGYYGSWSAYRDGNNKCRIIDIDADLCTHYIWSFLKIKNNKVAFDSSNDEDSLKDFVSYIRRNNSNAKVMAAVGGWTFSQNSTFKDMADSPRNRSKFFKSVINLMADYELDGIDIDWEFPDESDRENFTELIHGLSLSCHAVGKQLSVAVAGSTIIAYKVYDVSKISAYADFINLMAYDLHGPWEDCTEHHAGWFGAGYVRAITMFWTGNGCAKNKLVVGIPAYGKTWTLADPSKHGIWDLAVGAGTPGDYTKEAGVLAYFEILQKFNDENWNKKFDSKVKSPYAYRGDQWISYENVKSAMIKARYIKEQQLGGAMFWSLDMDDFDGNHGEAFPIVKAVKRILEE